MIDDRTKRILEYDKIIHELTSFGATDTGKELCMLLEPSNDPETVLNGLKTTDDAVKIIIDKAVPPLSGFVDIRTIILRAQTGASLSCKELLSVSQFLRAASNLRRFFPESSDKFRDNVVYEIIKKVIPVNSLEQAISYAIASEDELYDHASPALANIRRKIKETQLEVKAHLEKVLRNNPKSLQEQLITLRGNRYVVPVRADHRSDIPGIVHDTSSSGATLFIEPYPVIEANNRIREYSADERDEIERILSALSQEVSIYTSTLSEDARLAADIDFIFAKAKLACNMNAMPPVINMEGRIKLLSARHPLIPKERVVPITIEIGYEYSTLVITGPNTGGKTVSLKTCGLFCLMAMAGLQIPAKENSEVSIFDTIIADIGDEQSIEQNLSTFSSHMSNLVKIVNIAGPSTLVLADELGSGTDPSEGSALAISILEHLQKRRCITIATTHYKELKIYAIRTPGVENACCEFDMQTLRPTYRLLIGIPGVSNAFAISKRLGLPDIIIDRAKEFLSQEEVEFEKVIADTENARKAAVLLEQDAKRLLADAMKEAEIAKSMRQELETKKKEILQRAREDARDYIDEAYEESQMILDEVKQTIKDKDLAETKNKLEEVRSLLKSKKNQLENEIGKATLSSYRKDDDAFTVNIGETYFTSAFGVSGMLVECADGKGNCVLLSGNKRIKVPISSLRKPDEYVAEPKGKTRKIQKSAMSGMTMSKKMNMGSEIKLLGFTVDEASEKLDKFIDDAMLTGIHTIRIVHGKGTGALRSAVTQQLRKDKRIKSFRLGEYGEGDSGVTIAEM
ncbi:MAG: endonuclease MutS2 [Saccharofermentanales bacterium]